MKHYDFTQEWFSSDGLSEITLNNNQELHFLEIGSFEGKSTIWFLDNFLKNQKSTITCIDPWINYSQGKNSLNTYGSNNSEWKFGDNGVKERFLYNILKSGHSPKVKTIQDLSFNILPQLLCQNKLYDLIFIDGNHVAPFVMMDSVMSWNLLKVGGYILFDDYAWGMNKEKTLRPKESIDYFVETFQDYIEVIYTNERKVVKRIK
jgi:predicted O-methyltransferase YrrM